MREEDERDEETESEKEEVKADLGLMDDSVFSEISDVQAKVPTCTGRMTNGFRFWHLSLEKQKTKT